MPTLIKAVGLGTYHNELGLKEGSLITADNIIIDRNDVIRPRRGLFNYGTAAPCCGTFDQLIEYKDRILPYDGTKLYFDCNCQVGTFTAFNGCFNPLEAGIRIKSVESNGNLYFTTDNGIKKISGTLNGCCNTNFVSTPNFITNAGAPKALDTTGAITFECGGFLSPLSKTAYRVVWGIKDANQNLILGSPSSRYVIANTSGCCNFANVCVTFTVPSDVTSTDFFYQLYRTGIVTTPCAPCVPCLEPGDEMNLVFEDSATAANIIAGTITVKDSTPDCFRESGTLLYTNPVSGCGILQANEKPPIAKDVELFRDTVFYANTSTIQREQFNILSVSCFTSECSKFIVGNCCSEREYTFVGAKEIFTVNTVANVTNSLNGDYILVNSASNEKKYFFWFESIACTLEPSAADTIGRIPVKVSLGSCDAASVVACKLQTCVTTLVDFTAVVCCITVTVTNDKNGNTTDATNGTTSPGFTFCVTTQGLGELANTGAGPAVIPAACVTPACNLFTEASHGFETGVRGQWTTNNCDLPVGLTTDTDFFIIKISCCTFKVATSRLTALAGTVVCICDAGTGTHTFTAVGGDVLLSSLTSPGQSIDETARSLVNIINRDACGITNAFYLSGEDDLPGIILLEAKCLSDCVFFIGVQDDCTDITVKFSPRLDNSIAIASMAGLCCCTKTRVTTCSAHGLVVCDCAYIYKTSNSTFGRFKVLAICGLTFDITQVFTCTSVGRVFDINQISDNEVKPNRLFFSKSGRPEAVPLVNFIDVGGRDDDIERIVALRDNLFIMKEDGVYILTGDAGSFSVRLLDNSTFILAPDSAAVLNNQIYMLSSQGVATVSDTGIGVVSRPIEDKIQEVSNERFNFRTASFGVGYESDRSYILWMPTTTTDTVATQVYRFNTFNRSWVRWTEVDARAGIINSVDDKLYISSGDNSFIRQERKNDDRTDFADREFSLCVSVQCPCACLQILTISNVCCVIRGDVLLQKQFVTVSNFNRTLRKLDLDVGLTCNDYFSALELKGGQCSATSLVDLHTKLDADDCTVCYTAPTAAPSTFATIRTDYNIIIAEINCCSTKTQFHDYDTIGATCCIEFESLVTCTCSCFNTVTLAFSMPYLAGPVTQFKGIKSTVDWAPQHFGDPSILKQIPEGTIVFDGNNFFDAIIAYSTDLSKDFDDRRFFGQGSGFWGGFDWSCAAWSGEGTDVPLRTLIPREKQRCRYITVRFEHDNAREDFTILGISLNARQLSTRAYRGIK